MTGGCLSFSCVAKLVWRSSTKTPGIRASYPGFIEPALATSIDKMPSGERSVHEVCHGALGGPTIVGLWRFRPPCARVSGGAQRLLLFPQLSSGPQHLFLIGFPVLGKQLHLSREPVQLHLSREPVLISRMGGRVGIANMFGRFKRHLHTLVTPGKPTVRKFLEVFERGSGSART
jgi:hypothetical protein